MAGTQPEDEDLVDQLCETYLSAVPMRAAAYHQDAHYHAEFFALWETLRVVDDALRMAGHSKTYRRQMLDQLLHGPPGEVVAEQRLRDHTAAVEKAMRSAPARRSPDKGKIEVDWGTDADGNPVDVREVDPHRTGRWNNMIITKPDGNTVAVDPASRSYTIDQDGPHTIEGF